MKARYFIYFLFLSFGACAQGKQLLSAADKSRIPYNSDVKLVFENQRHEKDTISFYRAITADAANNFIIGGRELSAAPRNKGSEAIIFNTGIPVGREARSKMIGEPGLYKYYFIFSFFKYQNDTALTFYYDISGWPKTLSLDTVKMISLTINNETLDDVFIIDKINSSAIIARMYWSIKTGLVRIEEKNGDSWVLIGKKE